MKKTLVLLVSIFSAFAFVYCVVSMNLIPAALFFIASGVAFGLSKEIN